MAFAHSFRNHLRSARVSALARPLAYTGLAGMLVGVLDPLEGSVVIVAGTALAALAALIAHSRYRWRLWCALGLVVLGVAVMWALSAVGGIGGTTGRSNWWGLLLLPYPIGWIVGLAAVFRMIRDESLGAKTR